MSEIVVPAPPAPVPVENRATRPRIAWSAVFAGAFVVSAVELLLIVLGVGVGLGLVQPYGGSGGGNLGLAAGLWWLISTIIAFVFGCYVAARLAGVPTRYDGMLHGLVIWGVTVVVAFFLFTWVIGGVVGGALSVAGGAVSAAGQGLKAALPELAATAVPAASTAGAGGGTSTVQQQAQGLLQPANGNPGAMSRQDAATAIAAALPDLAAGDGRAAQAKDRIITIMAAQLNVSRDEAAKQFDAAEARFDRLRTEAARAAQQAADKSATAASRAGYATFVVVLLDAIAACVGGALAVPRRRRRVDERVA